MSSQTCTSLRCTELSGAQVGALGELAALGKSWGSHGYNSQDNPMCIGLSDVSAAPTPTVGHAISSQHVDFTNGHQVASNYPVCHGGWWLPRSAC